MTLSLTAVLTLVFWLTQALRFFDYVVNRGMSAVDLIELSLLILPTHLSNIAALAIFCAVMFVYLRARADGELVSMRASGLSPWRLSWPAVLAGLVSAISLELVSVYAAPPALTASRDRQIDLQEQHAWFAFLEAGVFTTIDGNFTVYVRERTHERVLKDVFIVDSRDESHAVVYTAEDASVRQANGAPVIDMRKGLRQEFSMLSEQAVSHHGGLVHFDRYTVPIRSDRCAIPDEKTARTLRARPHADCPDSLPHTASARGKRTVPTSLHTSFPADLGTLRSRNRAYPTGTANLVETFRLAGVCRRGADASHPFGLGKALAAIRRVCPASAVWSIGTAGRMEHGPSRGQSDVAANTYLTDYAHVGKQSRTPSPRSCAGILDVVRASRFSSRRSCAFRPIYRSHQEHRCAIPDEKTARTLRARPHADCPDSLPHTASARGKRTVPTSLHTSFPADLGTLRSRNVLTRQELRTSSRLFVLRAFAGVVLMQVIPLVSEKLSLQYGGYVLPLLYGASGLLYGASGLLVVWSMVRLVGSRTLRPTRT